MANLANPTVKTTIDTIVNPTHIIISFEEYFRLKEIETRFKIMQEQMIHADFVPDHQQVILGIKKECEANKAKKELNLDMLPLVAKKKG